MIDFTNEKTAKSFIKAITDNMPNIISIGIENYYVNISLKGNETIKYIYTDEEFIPYCNYPTDPILFEEEHGFPFFEEENEI